MKPIIYLITAVQLVFSSAFAAEDMRIKPLRNLINRMPFDKYEADLKKIVHGNLYTVNGTQEVFGMPGSYYACEVNFLFPKNNTDDFKITLWGLKEGGGIITNPTVGSKYSDDISLSKITKIENKGRSTVYTLAGSNKNLRMTSVKSVDIEITSEKIESVSITVDVLKTSTYRCKFPGKESKHSYQ